MYLYGRLMGQQDKHWMWWLVCDNWFIIVFVKPKITYCFVCVGPDEGSWLQWDHREVWVKSASSWEICVMCHIISHLARCTVTVSELASSSAQSKGLAAGVKQNDCMTCHHRKWREQVCVGEEMHSDQQDMWFKHVWVKSECLKWTHPPLLAALWVESDKDY